MAFHLPFQTAARAGVSAGQIAGSHWLRNDAAIAQTYPGGITRKRPGSLFNEEPAESLAFQAERRPHRILDSLGRAGIRPHFAAGGAVGGIGRCFQVFPVIAFLRVVGITVIPITRMICFGLYPARLSFLASTTAASVSFARQFRSPCCFSRLPVLQPHDLVTPSMRLFEMARWFCVPQSQSQNQVALLLFEPARAFTMSRPNLRPVRSISWPIKLPRPRLRRFRPRSACTTRSLLLV